jgi:Heliorhodopsin
MSTNQKLQNLHRFNLAMAGLHAVQGVAILLLSTDFSLPISASFLQFNQASQTLEPAQETLFNLSLPLLVVVFFFLSAAAHLMVGTVYRKRYEANLQKGINKVRWFEYSASASVMMVAIGLLVGMYDAASLIALFSLVAIMNLTGLAMEVYNQGKAKPNWLAYYIGTLAGIVPWVMIALYLWSGAHNGSAAPTFVYWIFVSIFLFFNCFAINMILQYKKVGKWRDYLYGEKAYIILSLTAKSVLAWQVFAGTLRP